MPPDRLQIRKDSGPDGGAHPFFAPSLLGALTGFREVGLEVESTCEGVANPPEVADMSLHSLSRALLPESAHDGGARSLRRAAHLCPKQSSEGQRLSDQI